MKIKSSKLRENIYKILDSVIKTGKVVEIERNGAIVRLIADKAPSKLSKLKKRSSTRGKIDKIYNISWEKEWSGNK